MFRLISAALVLGALALAAPAQASRIAFIRDGDVYKMRPDGGAVQRLTSLPADTSARPSVATSSSVRLSVERYRSRSRPSIVTA